VRSQTIGLRIEIWSTFARVRRDLRRSPLPEVVRSLASAGDARLDSVPPTELGRAVDRTLRLFGRHATCLVGSLVLFRLLRRRGEDAEVVIGLPVGVPTHVAHAWVEVDGRDVGPPPGPNGHVQLARFG
jgi:hypothetical protein